MATDQQVALARPSRGQQQNLTKTARQTVPPFLQKLYEMVNDPSNNDLIRWSDAGDSFFVVDHDRFAKELLGRWFKHQRFSSFVRQLNMYGFHKIPHLQQGVLKSEADTEFWNFEHPNFLRGKPDLLCLIQRKKQAASGGVDDDHLLENRDPNVAPSTSSLTAGQLLDINSVVNGISVIKRHQTAISEELNELKTSNQQLWQEAIVARDRHKKQQDTINRILKFLAGVFGHNGAGKAGETAHSPPAMMPRKRQRLMIGDGRESRGDSRVKAVEIVSEDEDEDDDGMDGLDYEVEANGHMPTSAPYAPADSPHLSAAPSEPVTPAAAEPPYTPSVAPRSLTSTPAAPATTPSTSYAAPSQPIHNTPTTASTSAFPPPPHQPHPTYPPNNAEPTLSPSALNSLTTTTSNGLQSQDSVMNAAFQQMLNSPSQMQRLLQAFANQNAFPFQTPSPDPQHVAPHYPPPHYDPSPSHSFGLRPENTPTSTQQPQTQPLQLYSPTKSLSTTLGGELPNLQPLGETSDRLAKTYQDAAEIDADVDALQHSIYTLIENLGLDPNLIQTQNQESVNHHLPSHPPTAPSTSMSNPNQPVEPPHPDPTAGLSMPNSFIESHADPAAQDFDFDAFLTEFSHHEGGEDYGEFAEKFANHAASGSTQNPSTEQLTAFLDEVASNASDGASPQIPSVPPHPSSPEQSSKARKRKSDVALLGVESIVGDGLSLGNQPKRKR
ncbi:hypothetical protein JAAARDRAFT_67635 [Jaapia argillacea MUCL 33604]|uniref:HSF-type DNA-binding domain-containing protein n=1 Tax=Jaapia argillacea MUCL 33604 TaxID=933084 RepID=A0A067Q2K0_9AGAM|nr:hypothetical protein JAAARDRAFT_67635 [Jaapia argillacea MUCL 33604]